MSNTTEARPGLSTEVIADFNQVKPTSVRERYSRTGSYFGLVPERLPNGRLSWPPDSRERLRELGKSANRPTPKREPRESEGTTGRGAS